MSRADGNFDPIEAVRAFLEEARCDSQIKRTEATIFTVSDASAAVGAPEEEILKSILLRVNHGKYSALALMSGVNKVDTKKVKRALGASHVSFAGAEECEEWSGFRPGGVPPVGYPEQPRTLLDEVEDPISTLIIDGKLHAGGSVTVDRGDDDRITLRVA